MKKCFKILSVLALAIAIFAMTLVTSFGASVSPDPANVYSATYNLRDFQLQASPDNSDPSSYFVNLANFSIYADDETLTNREPTNITIPPQLNDPAPTFYLSTYTSLDVDSSRLFTGIQVKNSTFTTTYFTMHSDITLHFGEMVLNPDLTSGAVNFFGLEQPYPSSYYITLLYSGECYFPLVSGGFRVVDFYVTGSQFDFDTPLDGDNFRFSLAPSRMSDNNSFGKMSAKVFYDFVYGTLSPEEREGLIDPSVSNFFKDGDPIALRSYTVSASLFYGNVDAFSTPHCQGVILEFPASISGVTRPDEDFLSAWNTLDNRPISFEEFDFVDWIETIIFGLGSVEIFPNFYLLYPIVGAVALALIIWALKIFLGG